MTEPTPTYNAANGDNGDVYLVEVDRFSGAAPSAPAMGDGANMLIAYFMRRRDVLIAELREIDRLLGRPQTVPVRQK